MFLLIKMAKKPLKIFKKTIEDRPKELLPHGQEANVPLNIVAMESVTVLKTIKCAQLTVKDKRNNNGDRLLLMMQRRKMSKLIKIYCVFGNCTFPKPETNWMAFAKPMRF